ncbi:SWI5-dependent HO expression protein 4 [Stygiomarasmius scandens]|uniref:SWI5-dependent HO expression protein 4 n=1 Tax=Marasmiellus scandens TaxID=2682957 RepID=A0ABR1JSZ1_9AGAR
MARLDEILHKTKQDSTTSLLPDELSYLITAFVPSEPLENRTKAYLILSAFCQGVRQAHPSNGQQPDPGTEALVKTFSPLIISRLEETNESDLLVGISFLTALFQVDWQSAAALFQQEMVLELIMDSVELSPSAELSLNVAHLLGQACGYKQSRTSLSSQATTWLEEKSRSTQDTALRAATAIALIKLKRGGASDKAENDPSQTADVTATDASLVAVMKRLIIDGGNQSSLADAVEGLAYSSTDPTVKEEISKDKQFLQSLFALVPKRKTAVTESASTILYGVLLIVSNVCAYKPQLTQEQKQMEKLRQMAKAKNGQNADGDELNDDAHVKERIKRLLSAGVLDVFSVVVPGADTPGVRLTVGKALLDIVTDKDNRGMVLQHGGAKILTSLIRKTTSEVKSNSTIDAVHLQPIQALAKLAITSSPVQVFGPNAGAMYDAIRPFSLMLQHPQSTLLQKFEGLMALTNLASASPEVATRVANADGLLSKAEFLVLDDHPLIQRAATELLCNLVVGCDKVFESYTSVNAGAKSKLQIILALCDAEDLQTRLAASGALATLTTAPGACQALLSLQLERHRVFPILTLLIDPSCAPKEEDETLPDSNAGLVHRGAVIAANFFPTCKDADTRKIVYQEASDAGLVKALENVAKQSKQANVAQTAASALKSLTELK